jgi:hypothetical protein
MFTIARLGIGRLLAMKGSTAHAVERTNKMAALKKDRHLYNYAQGKF